MKIFQFFGPANYFYCEASRIFWHVSSEKFLTKCWFFYLVFFSKQNSFPHVATFVNEVD